MKIIRFLLFHIGIITFCNYCVNAGSIAASGINLELRYIDSLNSEINSWFDNPNFGFEDIIKKLEQTDVDARMDFGAESIVSAFVIHKKGVAWANIPEESETAYKNAVFFYTKALKIRQKYKKTYDSLIVPDLILGYSNISRCLLRINKPYQALAYLNKGLELANEYEYKSNIIKSQLKLYTLAARTYYELGDYDNTIKYYQLIIYFPKYENEKEAICLYKQRAGIELGGVLAWPLMDADGAIDKLLFGIKELDNAKSIEEKSVLAGAYSKLGSAYHNQGEFRLSKQCYKKSLIISNMQQSNSTIVFDTYINLNALYVEAGQIDSAEFFNQKATELLDPNSDSLFWSEVFENLATIYYERKDYFKSLELCDRALSYRLSVQNTSIEELIGSEASLNILINPSFLRLFAVRSLTLMELHKTTSYEKHLKEAYLTDILNDKIIDALRSGFIADASKMSLVKQTKPIYEQAIETCWQLFTMKGNVVYLNQAFKYSEKSRAIILLDAVRRTAAKEKLPAELVEHEKQTNLKANYYEKQAALQNLKKYESGTYISYYDSLLSYRRKHAAITEEIKIKKPGYYKAIFDKDVCSLENVKGFLTEDQTFIEYFVGDSNLYAFAISKEEHEFIKLGPVDSLNQWINKFNMSIQEKDLGFIDPGFKIYTQLLLGIDRKMPLSENLIIVPDDIISTLCFDALITQKPKNIRVYLPDFKEYLVYKYQVSNVFSASALQETILKPDKKLKTFLGIAPDFQGGITFKDSYFGELVGNRREVKRIKRMFSNSKILGEFEPKKSFVTNAFKYNIIHLATHAKANMKNGDLSYILFGTKETQKLYAKDLYTLELNADMVVLSACQTGKGVIERGEGVVSLARGFIYAGASSVITSLWNVREKTNNKIILSFYKGIKKGKAKDQSLRDAKLEYLGSVTRENQEQAHPFYWGPIICVGDTSPFISSSNIPSILFIICFVLIALVVFLLFYSKRKKSN